MKTSRIFLFFLFMGLGAAVFGAPFGFLPEPHEIQSGAHKNKYLIDKIANGRPVSICVDGRLDKYSLSKAQIDAALNSWFKHAYRTIVRAKRQREFQDLLPLLSKGVDIRLQNCSNTAYFQTDYSAVIKAGSGAPGYAYASSKEDLRIILADWDDTDGSSYFMEGSSDHAPYVVFNDIESVNGLEGLNILRHELGHALSLSDQYQSARLNSAAEYGTSDVLPSMMQTHSDKFTCDDADGLIFALDCVAQKNTSRGGEEGWRSFCPQRAGRNYAKCKTKNREDLLWVSNESVRYARYDRQGNLTAREDWERVDSFRLPRLYPNGILSVSAEAFTPVYKGKYVSYKKSANMDCIFSTRVEQGEVVSMSPGDTLIACAKPQLKEALVLLKGKNSLTVPPSTDGSGYSFSKNNRGIFVEETPSVSRQIRLSFDYTPQVRFEYYWQGWRKVVVFMFLKGSSKFYVFDGRRLDDDSPSFAGAPAVLPSSANEYPALQSRPVDKEVEAMIRRLQPRYLLNHGLDTPDEGDYCVSNQTLPADFLAVNPLGRAAWDLHAKYRRFFEGTIQNWMPGSVSDGFAVSAEGKAEESARAQLARSMGGRARDRR